MLDLNDLYHFAQEFDQGRFVPTGRALAEYSPKSRGASPRK